MKDAAATGIRPAHRFSQWNDRKGKVVEEDMAHHKDQANVLGCCEAQSVLVAAVCSPAFLLSFLDKDIVDQVVDQCARYWGVVFAPEHDTARRDNLKGVEHGRSIAEECCQLHVLESSER